MVKVETHDDLTINFYKERDQQQKGKWQMPI